MDKFDISATAIIKKNLVSKLGRELTEIETAAFSMPRSGIAYEMIDDYITSDSKSVQDIESYVYEVVEEYREIIARSNMNGKKHNAYPISLHLKEKPYNLLGLVAVLFFIFSFFTKGEAFDISMHDSYFVIANVSLFRVFSGVLLFLWSLYLLFGRFTWSKKLTWWHVIFSILTPLFFILGQHLPFSSLDGIPRRYYAFTEFPRKPSFFDLKTMYVIILVILVLGQLLFLINIIIGAVMRLRKRFVSTASPSGDPAQGDR